MTASLADTVRKQEHALKIGLPCLDVNIVSLQLPDTATTKLVVRSKLKGQTSQNERKEIHFAVELSIAKSSGEQILEVLGLKHAPQKNIALSLFTESNELNAPLKMSIKSLYQGQARGTRIEQYRARDGRMELYDVSYHPRGQHTPKEPKVSPRFYNYDIRKLKYRYEVDKTELINSAKVDQSAFNELYLAVMNSKESPKKGPLLNFLHEKFADLSEASQSWITQRLEREVEEAKARFLSEAGKLETLRLPRVRRVQSKL